MDMESNRRREPSLRKRCINCRFAGKRFKIRKNGMTHMHCEHPELKPFEDPWDSIMEFWQTCKYWRYGKA